MKVRNEFRKMNLKGIFEIYLHPYFPLFHSQCIDGDDSEYGQMIVSNYLFDTKRSEALVLQFSRSSNPKIFENLLGLHKKSYGQIEAISIPLKSLSFDCVIEIMLSRKS